MNKFFIALLVTIFGFSFSNKAFSKSVIVEKKKNNMIGEDKNEKNYGCAGSSKYGEFSSE